MIVAYDNEAGCWVAAGNGPLRPIVQEGNSRVEAENAYLKAYENQQADEYAMHEQMAHLGDEAYGDGGYGEDLG